MVHRTYDKCTSFYNRGEEPIMASIAQVIKFVEFITSNNLVVYTWGSTNVRVGDANYHVGVYFYKLPYRKQIEIAERTLREYESRYWDDWSYVDQCAGNPFWVLAFLYGEEYARYIVNGEEPIDDEYFYDEEEDRLLGIRCRISA